MFIWKRIIKPLLEWIGHFETVQSLAHTEFFRTLLLPTVWTVLTAAGGYVGQQPIMWIMMASTLTFMSATIAMLGVGLLKEMKNPQNKLNHNLAFSRDLTPAPMPVAGNRQARRAHSATAPVQMLGSTTINIEVERTLDRGQLGVDVTNKATFGISVILYRAETEIEGCTPPRSTFPKAPHLLGPGETIRLNDDRMDLKQIPCGRLSGKIDVVIKYGLPGKRYSI